MSSPLTVRRAGVEDADVLALMLHEFNLEFDTATPGAATLAPRLRTLLAGEHTLAYLGGTPATGFALITLRSNVWYDGPVALLDELYVVPEERGQGIGTAIVGRFVDEMTGMGIAAIEINVDESDVDAQRFYERHGFSGRNTETGERAFYYIREL